MEEVDEVADVASVYFIISLKKALVTEWRIALLQFLINSQMICGRCFPGHIAVKRLK